MVLTQDLQSSAYRSGDEYAWKRGDALRAIESLTTAGLAILGGEVWLIAGDDIVPIIPQKDGVAALEHWTCERHGGEQWRAYVFRSATEARSAIQRLPDLTSAAVPTHARIYYNITWTAESEQQHAG